MSTPETTRPDRIDDAANGSGSRHLTGELLPVLGVTCFAFIVFAWLSVQSIPYGISAVGAERVLNGEIPYRDFWTIYAPGQFYLLAALFAIFGHDASVSAIAGSLLCAGAVGLAFRLMWKITGRWTYALACSALFMAAWLTSGYYGFVTSYTGVMFCLLIAFNFFQHYLDRGVKRFLIAAGLAAGVGAWFKHDVGAYGTIAMLAGLAAHHLAARGAMRLRTVLGDLVTLGLAAASAVLPVLLVFAVLAGKDIWQDLIVTPATIFPLAHPENYPSLIPTGLNHVRMVQSLSNWSKYLYFALPFLTCLASLPFIVATLFGRQAKLAGFGVAFTVLFWLHYSAAHVQINTHIISMTLYAACLGAVSVHGLGLSSRLRSARWIRALAFVVAVGWFATLVAWPIYNLLGRELLTGRKSERVSLSLPKVSWVRMPPRVATDWTALVKFVQGQVPPGQPIYVGQSRHDVVVIGWPHIYFMLDRPPATRYEMLEAGLVDTAPIQAEMVRDLKNKNVQLIVLVKVFDDDDMDRKKAFKQRNLPQVGATLLDEFIHSNYEQVKQFRWLTVWLKKAH